jgi:hypothetical protein
MTLSSYYQIPIQPTSVQTTSVSTGYWFMIAPYTTLNVSYSLGSDQGLQFAIARVYHYPITSPPAVVYSTRHARSFDDRTYPIIPTYYVTLYNDSPSWVYCYLESVNAR